MGLDPSPPPLLTIRLSKKKEKQLWNSRMLKETCTSWEKLGPVKGENETCEDRPGRQQHICLKLDSQEKRKTAVKRENKTCEDRHVTYKDRPSNSSAYNQTLEEKRKTTAKLQDAGWDFCLARETEEWYRCRWKPMWIQKQAFLTREKHSPVVELKRPVHGRLCASVRDPVTDRQRSDQRHTVCCSDR